MAGRRPEVDHVKKDFLRELERAEKLFTKIRELSSVKSGALHHKDVRQVVELAFIGMVASWEEFLERALVRYVAGAKTKAGYAPTPKFGQANSLKHAYEVLSNNPRFDSSRDYLKVSDPKWITNAANFLFSSHGFTDIGTNSSLLKHAVVIRNRVAHSSNKCRADFRKTAIHFLDPQDNKLTQGYGPGDLLQADVVRHFEQAVLQKKKTHFSAYVDLYQSLADKIVP